MQTDLQSEGRCLSRNFRDKKNLYLHDPTRGGVLLDLVLMVGGLALGLVDGFANLGA